MCCDSTAALAGAFAGFVAVEFTLAGAGFFLAGVEADGVGFEATAAEPDARLSLVLMVATCLPEILTPFSAAGFRQDPSVIWDNVDDLSSSLLSRLDSLR